MVIKVNTQSAVHLDASERFKIWKADILHGYHLLAFLGTSGLLLFGLAILVGRLFQPATGYELPMPASG